MLSEKFVVRQKKVFLLEKINCQSENICQYLHYKKKEVVN